MLFICLCIGLWAQAASGAQSIDSRAYIRKAVDLIQAESYPLARTYLAPALIDPRLSPAERSAAYYLHGFSFEASGLPLGSLYARGDGVPQDQELAFAFFDGAAQAGHPQGRLFVGFALLEGLGVEQNIPLGREKLATEAEGGSASAMFYLGRSYRPGFGDQPHPQLARNWYEKALAAGSVEAGVALGYMHYKGELGEADHQAAARLFEAASAQGSSVADVALGHMYLVGEGVPVEPDLARQLLERAAEAGNLAGCLSLGHIFEAGIGVERDMERAEGWYLRGAKAGFGQAQLRLFYLLLDRGQEAEAARWVAQAAEQNLAQAQNDYAWLLSTSQSDALRDGALALTYAERAVAQVPSAAYLDTLAAAYAELGRFGEAISTQQQALALVAEAGSAEALALAAHLEAYQDGKPWRE
jgi:TPR repeat protein